MLLISVSSKQLQTLSKKPSSISVVLIDAFHCKNTVSFYLSTLACERTFTYYISTVGL